MSHHSARGARAFRFVKAGNIVTSPTDLENAAASALAGAPDGATFVTLHTADGVQHFFVTDDAPGQEGVAFSIARSMAAHSTEVDEVPDLPAAGGFAKLVFRTGTRPMMDTQTGADFTALSRIVGDMLKPGEWVAMSVRKPGMRTEVKWHNRWLDHHGLRTHHSRKTGAPVVAMYAGGQDSARARMLCERVAAAIPGFGLSVQGKSVTAARASGMWALVAGAAAAVFAAGMLVPWEWPAPVVPVSAAAAAVALVMAVLTARGILPSERTKLMKHLVWGRVPAAPRRVSPPRKPRQESTRNGKDGQPQTVAEFGGDYPLVPSAFLIGPHLPVELIAPHSAASGATTTAMRHAPAEMLEPIGPQLGLNMDRMVRLSSADMWSGVAAIGQSGSGKTALLEHLWGSASRERVSPSGIAGAPVQHALIAFDTKGDGQATAEYTKWLLANGDTGLVTHALDPHDTQPAIDLFPSLPGETPAMWARKVVSAMRYIWGEDSIGAESFDTLSRVLAGAKVVTPLIASRVQLRTLPQAASPFYYANILLTNEGDELATELAGAIMEAAVNPATATQELTETAGLLAPVFGDGRTPSQRAALVKAPRTKVAALMAAESWWSRPAKYTWEQLLTHNAAVIVNTGVGPSGLLPDEKLRTDMSGLLMYTLAEQIKRTCIGWYEQGRAVSIFADEVKHLANTSAEVINWMRHDARANGVRAVFATQTPETLVTEVRQTVLGFGTLVLYAQNDEGAARKIVADLQMSGSEWELSDVVNLERYQAIVRATAGGRRQDPFTVQVPNFRAMRDAGTWTP